MQTDGQLILIFIGLSTLLNLFFLIKLRNDDNACLIAGAVFVLVVMAISLSIFPTIAVLASVVVWFFFLMLPGILFWKLHLAIYQHHFKQGRVITRLLRYLCPTFKWRSYIYFMKANELAMAGQFSTAQDMLEAYPETRTEMGLVMKAYVYRLTWQWEKLLTWLTEQLPKLKNPRSSAFLSLLLYQVRAFGELGQLNAMIAQYHQYRSHFRRYKDLNDTAQLFIFSFCGKVATVDYLFSNSTLKYLPNEGKNLWRATATWQAGDKDEAIEAFVQLQSCTDHVSRYAAERRLQQMPERIQETLSADNQVLLAEWEMELAQEKQLDIRGVNSPRKAYTTYSLMFMCILVFFLEIWQGGSRDLHTLYRLGALWPYAVIEYQQFWRLITSIFLHFGTSHLLFNVIALWLIGPFVEKKVGILKFLVIFFITGIGANLVYIGFFLMQFEKQTFVLAMGASGAILGLLGAWGALLLHSWQVEKTRVASKYFWLILLIVGLQTIIDFSLAQVSLVHHLSGVIIGFITTLVVLSLRNKHA